MKPASNYAATWVKSLAIDNVPEDWHLDVIQGQFIDAEQVMIRNEFMLRHGGDDFFLGCHSIPVSKHVVLDTLDRQGNPPESDRRLIIAKAAEVLRKHGREPRLDLLWAPDLSRGRAAPLPTP